MSGQPNYDPQTTQSFYDRISGAYDAISNSGEHDARVKGIEMLALQPGEAVLDIGFGTGSAISEMAPYLGDGDTICGIDISPGMKEVAEKKMAEKGVKQTVKLSVGDARKLPYEDGSFDAVYMSFTLELFPAEDIPKVLAEAKRVLKPGGRFGVVGMASVKEGEKESELEKTYKWMHRHFPHIVDCRPINVEGAVRDAGFDITNSQRIEIWTMPVACVVGVAS